MKNVVITGMGIKSCIGNEYNSVLKNLQEGKSGIIFNETYPSPTQAFQIKFVVVECSSHNWYTTL